MGDDTPLDITVGALIGALQAVLRASSDGEELATTYALQLTGEEPDIVVGAARYLGVFSAISGACVFHIEALHTAVAMTKTQTTPKGKPDG